MAPGSGVERILRAGYGVTTAQGWIIIGLLALIAGLISDIPREKR